MLHLHTFGTLAIESGEAPLSGAATHRRRLALLAFIAAAGPRGVSREKIAAHFCSEGDEERARHAVNQAVYALRKNLGAEQLLLGVTELRLNPRVIGSDIGAFADALRAGNDVEAVEIYKGPFLESVHVTRAPEFEEWAEAQRRRLATARATALNRLAALEERAGNMERAVHWHSMLAAHDPLDSRQALRLMKALVTVGEAAGALRHFRVHATLVRREVGIEPGPQLIELARQLELSGRSFTRRDSTSRDAGEPRSEVVSRAEDRDADRKEPAAAATNPAPESVSPASTEAQDRSGRPSVASGWRAARLRLSSAAPASRWRLDRTFRVWAAAGATAIALLAGLAAPPAAPLTPDRLVVAPFLVLERSLEPWSTGVMGVVASNLDGLSELHVIRLVDDKPRAPAAGAVFDASRLSREHGSRFVVTGYICPDGTDSIRVATTVYDAIEGRTIGWTTHRGSARLIGTISEKLAEDILDILGNDRVSIVQHP